MNYIIILRDNCGKLEDDCRLTYALDIIILQRMSLKIVSKMV
jgi:hypothetical protein